MGDVDLAELRRRHRQYVSQAAFAPKDGICLSDNQNWPCETIRLAAEVERLRAVAGSRLADLVHERMERLS